MKSKAKSKKKSNLRILKDMFLVLLPVLHNQGFVESPFVNSSPGWHPWLGYIYDFARLDESQLELFSVIIPIRSASYEVRYTILEVFPKPNNISDIKNGCEFVIKSITDNIGTERLPYLFYEQNIIQRVFMYPSGYILKFRFTKWGRRRQEQKLFERVKSDFERIDKAKKNWYKRHTPIVVDWNGDPISSNSDKPNADKEQ